jgi:hypothetical protein
VIAAWWWKDVCGFSAKGPATESISGFRIVFGKRRVSLNLFPCNGLLDKDSGRSAEIAWNSSEIVRSDFTMDASSGSD